MREIHAEGSPLNRQVVLPAERFIYSETISGALLLVWASVALAWANSPWSQSYFALTFAIVADVGSILVIAIYYSRFAHCRIGRVSIPPVGEPCIKTARGKGKQSMNLTLAYL